MERNSSFSSIQNLQSKGISSNTPNSGNNENSQLPQHNVQSQQDSFPQNIINKTISKPIGIYNFNSNKLDISSLEENINEVVTTFIEENKENIMKYVIKEVESKLNEKINPLNTEISTIKNTFTSLYNQELKDFKELNILNECHNNIMNINDRVNIVKDNINKYNDEIKGFSISDNRLQFLNKLNKDLQEFINGINNERENGMDIDIDEENNKIEAEQKRQDNINQELDNIFNETISLLKSINKEEDITINEQMNKYDIVNNLINAINLFESKFNYEKPIINDEQKQNNNKGINNSFNKKKSENALDSIPDFFELNI